VSIEKHYLPLLGDPIKQSPEVSPMSSELRVAIGPVMPGWGCWEWVGADMADELSRYCQTETFTYDWVPDSEVIVIIKHPPPAAWWDVVKQRSLLIYAPVDHYESLSAIDADAGWLNHVQHMVVHCHRLRHYFLP